jgi:TRAP-type C4-dicarboxylate transport system permease small subunit
MKRLLNIWLNVGKVTHTLAGMALMAMFFITLGEVIMRFLWRSIPGTFELISLLGGAVAGLAVPRTSQMKGHVNVDFVLNKLSPKGQGIMNGITRFLVMVFFIFVAWSLLSMGMDYRAAREVSPSMKLPLYPVFFFLGGAFLVQVVQFILDIVKTFGGSDE